MSAVVGLEESRESRVKSRESPEARVSCSSLRLFVRHSSSARSHPVHRESVRRLSRKIAKIPTQQKQVLSLHQRSFGDIQEVRGFRSRRTLRTFVDIRGHGNCGPSELHNEAKALWRRKG